MTHSQQDYVQMINAGTPIGESSKSTPGRRRRRGINLVEATRVFGDQELTSLWLEKTRWGNEPMDCPHSGETASSRTKNKIMAYRCNKCHKRFSLKTGTAMADSKIPITKWLLAAYLDLTNL